MSTNLETTPFVLYSLLPAIIAFFLSYRFLPTTLEKKKRVLSLFISLATFIVFFLSLPILNMKLDDGVTKTVESTLSEEFSDTKKDCKKPLHWETKKPLDTEVFCLSEYRYYHPKEPVMIEISQGFLGVPWLKDIHLKRYFSKDLFLKAFNDPMYLKFYHTENFLRIHGIDALKEERDQWKKKCLSKSNIFFCRPAAHVFLLMGDKKQMKKLFQFGCENGDGIACLNYGYNKEFSKKEIKQARKTMIKNCRKNKIKLMHTFCKEVKSL